ncbi:kinase-like domain-containing protein [Mycena galericulata]|nr:kinase-like domain-containing protein [Mycena galericulata]
MGVFSGHSYGVIRLYTVVLRPRYQEGWVPSWKGTKQYRGRCEDGIEVVSNFTMIMDATRIQDGTFVMMKQIRKRDHPFEVDIATWLSSEPQRSDPQNHCVPIYEVLQPPDDPDMHILVMPVLTPFDNPRFDTVGEVVAFFTQIFEGMKYMHAHNVTHRDCAPNNIMMDASPIVKEPFHPIRPNKKRDFSASAVYLSRTQHPVKYYLIDFGMSVKYGPEDRRLERSVFGADKTVPEFQRRDAPNCDPFPVDVYCIGNLIRTSFTERGLEFMEPLVADMVNSDPALRPTMDEVVNRFEEIVARLSSWKLRSRVVHEKDVFGVVHSNSHWLRRLQLVIGRYPPIPMP